MTHIQEVFIKNLRYFRIQKGYSQLRFSELVNISPNYLNAVENGKNMPSPEVLQRMLDVLNIFPYQLFLEQPVEIQSFSMQHHEKNESLIQELVRLKQELDIGIDNIIKNCSKPETDKNNS